MLRKLLQPIDIAPLIAFRIFFGFLLFAETLGAILTGWVKKVLITPVFTFSHIGLEWLQPLPGSGMYFYFGTMAILGLLVMIGYKYRTSLSLFTVLWAGAYLMQKESYNNHYYLLLLVCMIMNFLPAGKSVSIDVRINPGKRSDVMPLWCSAVMILQVAIVYFFATVSKFYPQWINGTFVRLMLQGSDHPAFLDGLFAKHWFHLFIAWSGMVFDFLIVPLLLWKKTRTPAFIASLFFHLFNAVILQIGIFPFFALSFVVFFYPPEKIKNVFFKKRTTVENPVYDNQLSVLKWFFVPYFLVQLILPIRHHFIKGDVLWTEEGHRLSWRMMLRQRIGNTSFRVVDKKTGLEMYYNYSQNLTLKQQNFVSNKPDGIWQMAQRIKNEYAEKGQEVRIFVNSSVSVNGGPYQKLINPETDLAQAHWNYFAHNDWILLPDSE